MTRGIYSTPIGKEIVVKEEFKKLICNVKSCDSVI